MFNCLIICSILLHNKGALSEDAFPLKCLEWSVLSINYDFFLDFFLFFYPCHVLFCPLPLHRTGIHMNVLSKRGVFIECDIHVVLKTRSDSPLVNVEIDKTHRSVSSKRSVGLIRQQWKSTDATLTVGLWGEKKPPKGTAVILSVLTFSISWRSQWISVKLLDLFRLRL